MFRSENSIKAWIVFLGLLTATLTSKPTEMAGDYLFGSATRLFQPLGFASNLNEAFGAVLLGVIALFFGYFTLSQFGLFGVTVNYEGEIKPVDVLVMTVSKPVRNDLGLDKSQILRRLDVLEALANETPGFHLRNSSKTGADEADLPFTLESLTTKGVEIVVGGTGEKFLASDFSWQQSWRVVNAQITGMQAQKLSRIELIKSAIFRSGDEADQFRIYELVLKKLLSGKTIEVQKARSTEKDELGEIQAIFKDIVKTYSGSWWRRSSRKQIGIDITGGNRVFAFAAATASLAKNTVMFYAQRDEANSDGDVIVQCYDMSPDLQQAG